MHISLVARISWIMIWAKTWNYIFIKNPSINVIIKSHVFNMLQIQKMVLQWNSKGNFVSNVGSQIILSTILAIQNNNHTQEHKIYVENPFSLKGKTTRQTPNNLTIIKSITIILVYVSRLKKNLSCFSLLSHT